MNGYPERGSTPPRPGFSGPARPSAYNRPRKLSNNSSSSNINHNNNSYSNGHRGSPAGAPSSPSGPPSPGGMSYRPMTTSTIMSTGRPAAGTMASSPRVSFESRVRSPSGASQSTFESFESIESFHAVLNDGTGGGTGGGSTTPNGSVAGTSAGPGPAVGTGGSSSPGGVSGWQRPSHLRSPRRKAKPGEQFRALPDEVLELMLAELKRLHLEPGSTSCATCWMRDCCSVALGSKRLLKVARTALYDEIQLVGADAAQQRKRYKPVVHTRVVLLRRTLRSNPQLAAMVHAVKVPGSVLIARGPDAAGGGRGHGGKDAAARSDDEYYLDLVASLVMACPNLERLNGLYPSFDHSFGRLFHALSTRQRLREMHWNLGPHARTQPTPAGEKGGGGGASSKHGRGSSGRAAQQQQEQQQQQHVTMMQHHELSKNTAFWDAHRNWQYLQTLTVHCQPGATLASDTLLTDIVSWLPSLQMLHVSHLPRAAFSDKSLLALPRLRKLSLVHLQGISSAGLSAFATRASAQTIESLALVHANLDSLPALARILANLRHMTSFTFVQELPPLQPADEAIWLFPYLASASLRSLHWDIIDQAFGPSGADTILARSIAAQGFPSLRRLRAPADPDGIFQALCTPQERVDLPDDQARAAALGAAATATGSMGGLFSPPGGARPGSRSSSRAGSALGSISGDQAIPTVLLTSQHGTQANPAGPPSPSFRSTFHRPRTDSLASLARTESHGSGAGSLALPPTPTTATSMGRSPLTPRFPFPPDIADLYGYPATPTAATAAGGAGGSSAMSLLAAQQQYQQPQHSSLLAARLAAQGRIEAARRFPRYFVNVTDEAGALVENYGLAGFLGAVESRIAYALLPDAGASDERGGLVGTEDFLGADGGEDLSLPASSFPSSSSVVSPSSSVTSLQGKAAKPGKKDSSGGQTGGNPREGCTGRWNTLSGKAVDKKDKERWWHTERGRWVGVALS